MRNIIAILLLLLVCVPCCAVDFDGIDQYVDSGDPYNPATSQAVSAWIHVAALDSVDHIIGTWNTTATPDQGWFFRVRGDLAGDPLQYTHAGVGDLTSSSSVLTALTWHHVVVSWDGTTATIYVDGNNVGSGSIGADVASTYNTFIGARNKEGTATLPFNGQIDDVRIYNRALPGSEVTATKHGINQVASGNIGQWLLIESAGTNLTHPDISGNGNAGTGTNGAAGTTDGAPTTWHSFSGGN